MRFSAFANNLQNLNISQINVISPRTVFVWWNFCALNPFSCKYLSYFHRCIVLKFEKHIIYIFIHSLYKKFPNEKTVLYTLIKLCTKFSPIFVYDVFLCRIICSIAICSICSKHLHFNLWLAPYQFYFNKLSTHFMIK